MKKFSPLRNKKILITAGPTREYMDPVRFISNPSSGGMGIAIAESLQKRGAQVTLVLGPTPLSPSKKIKTIRVISALDMSSAVRRKIAAANAFIATAAVGDWRFKKIFPSKMKKNGSDKMTVRLIRNPDILAEAGKIKKERQLLVGFALETDRQEKNAMKKLREKNLDLIVANSPASFSNPRIQAQWIERLGRIEKLPAMSKRKLAEKLAAWLARKWKTN